MEEMKFIECVNLLKECVDIGIIMTDKERPDNIIIYCEGTETNPEGWYSENILEVASELFRDKKGQEIVLNALNEKKEQLEKLNNGEYKIYGKTEFTLTPENVKVIEELLKRYFELHKVLNENEPNHNKIMEYGKRVKETYKKAKELGFPYWLKDDIIAFAIKNDLTQCTVEDFFNIYSKEKEINKKELPKKANIEKE